MIIKYIVGTLLIIILITAEIFFIIREFDRRKFSMEFLVIPLGLSVGLIAIFAGIALLMN